MKVTIRLETAGDIAGVRAVNLAAFERAIEADLVDRVRSSNIESTSIVALDSDIVVGHIFFTPATIQSGKNPVAGMALGPMAVLPDYQRKGIGSSLAELGIALLRRRKCPYVIVLGHPNYYHKFGFTPAASRGLNCPWDGVPTEAFMVLILDESVMSKTRGTVLYLPEFSSSL